ncbi:Mitotic spindle checkpoint protein MAD2 [Linum perenne]
MSKATCEVMERWNFSIETDSEVVEKGVLREKSDKEIMREIQPVMCQIASSITYLPWMDEQCRKYIEACLQQCSFAQVYDEKCGLSRYLNKFPPSVGGSRKIFGLCYTNDSKVPKRSRQLAWRATVEECKNLSKLALQVRYLIIDGVGFTNQKHLPSRVMKNVIRTKQKEGGNNNYWFPNHMYHYI